MTLFLEILENLIFSKKTNKSPHHPKPFPHFLPQHLTGLPLNPLRPRVHHNRLNPSVILTAYDSEVAVLAPVLFFVGKIEIHSWTFEISLIISTQDLLFIKKMTKTLT